MFRVACFALRDVVRALVLVAVVLLAVLVLCLALDLGFRAYDARDWRVAVSNLPVKVAERCVDYYVGVRRQLVRLAGSKEKK